MQDGGVSGFDVWSRAQAVQPAPDHRVILGVAALAAVVVVGRRPWALSRHAVTIAHEAAHGIVALLGGRRLAGIRLHSDTSGVTLSRGRPRGPGMVAMLAAGYLGPACIGLAAAVTLTTGHAVGLLCGLVVALAAVLVQIRSLFGLWSVLLSGTIVGAATWWLPPSAQSAFAYLVTWFLLLAAPRSVLGLITERRRTTRSRPGALVSDPDQLAAITVLPAWAWIALFALGTFGALVGGAGLLVR